MNRQSSQHDASDGSLTSFRITIAYFCLSALDLLGALDDHVALDQRQRWADWIWSLQSREWAGASASTDDALSQWRFSWITLHDHTGASTT